MQKRSLQFVVFKRIAVCMLFIDRSNGLDMRLNARDYLFEKNLHPFKTKNCHPFKPLEVSINLKKLSSVQKA